MHCKYTDFLSEKCSALQIYCTFTQKMQCTANFMVGYSTFQSV